MDELVLKRSMDVARMSPLFFCKHYAYTHKLLQKIMPRTISRSERMTESIVMRCTQADKAKLKLAAQEKGLDMTTFLRQLLIQNHVIDPI